MIQQPSTICNAISGEAGEVLNETDISPDPHEEATAVPTDSIVDHPPNTSPLEISTVEHSSDEKARVSVQDTRPVERPRRSSLSELLVYPSSTNKAGKSYIHCSYFDKWIPNQLHS